MFHGPVCAVQHRQNNFVYPFLIPPDTIYREADREQVYGMRLGGQSVNKGRDHLARIKKKINFITKNTALL